MASAGTNDQPHHRRPVRGSLAAPILSTGKRPTYQLRTGLDKVGVSGLALFPEGTRMLFIFPRTGAQASRCCRKNCAGSPLRRHICVADGLRGHPDDLVGEAFPDGLAAGKVVAAESSFAFAGSLPEPATATGNLVLYPKLNSLVANAKTFQALSEAQRQVLKDAAAATRTWAAEAMTATADDAAAFCKAGGTIVTATEDEIAAFKAAGAPVYAMLEADPETKTRISKIRDLAAGEPAPTAIKPCGPGG